MFYNYDILQKRGKFGIIWLAATSRRRITRRDIASVNVERSCDDVISILTLHETLEKRKARLSLYLSSQLLYGLVVVQSQKSSYLYDETRNMLGRLTSFQLPIETCIDLVAPADKFKVTFSPPNMDDASPDFGRLEPFPDPSEHLSYEYFLVTTPRSSEEWIISPGSRELDRARFESALDGVENLNTSFREDITMEDVGADNEEPIPFEMAGQDVDFLAGPFAFLDLPPAEQIERGVLPELQPLDQLTPPQDEPIPPPRDQPIPRPRDQPIPRPRDQPIPRPRDQPIPPPRDQPIPRPRDHPIPRPRGQPIPPPRDQPPPPDESSSPSTPRAPIPVGVDVPPTLQRQVEQESDEALHPPTPPERRPRRPVIGDDAFILDPVVDPTRRRRRRRRILIVDPVIALTPQQIQNNIRTANERLTVPMIIPRLLEPANSLLQRLSARNVPSAIQNLMNRFKTLPEPNQAMDLDEEPTEVIEEPPAEEPIAVTIHVPEDESSVEARRALDSLEATRDPSTGGLFTSSSLKVPDASSGTLHGTRDISTSPIPRVSVDFHPELILDQEPVLNIPQPDFELGTENLAEEAQPMEEVLQPDVEMEEEIREEPQPRPTVPVACQWSPVSPERIPPPSSYESLTPELEELMAMIRSKAAESMFPQYTSFSTLIEEIQPSRKNVATLFHRLLCLHTQGKIKLNQPQTGREIFIKILLEEEEELQ